MSRTVRNFIDRYKSYELESDKEENIFYTDTRDGYQSKNNIVRRKRMKPYSIDKVGHKFKQANFFNSSFRRTGHEHKEEIRNANRSRKKSMRQYLKKELSFEIEQINFSK